MNLLLDTHALIWWTQDDPKLSRRAHSAIANAENTVYASAVSAMEISTKFRIGKLGDTAGLALRFEERIEAEDFRPLAISVTHGRLAGTLSNPHKDPFDRLLIAQALTDDLILVSNEVTFDAFGVKRLW